VVSHHDAVRDTAEFGLLRLVRVVAVILPSAALIQVLASPGDYRQPAVAVTVWLGVLATAVWLAPRTLPDGLARGEAAAAVLIAVAAVAAIGWVHRAHYPPGSVDLVILGTVCLLALVALSYPAWVWLAGALAVFAVHATLLIRALGANPLTLSQLEVCGYILANALIAFAALRPTLAVHTSMITRRASLASRSRAERAAAAAVLEDRRSRLALLEMNALPLLRGIADGSVDPTADEVRERCARHAAALRQSLADRAQHGAGLVAGLEPALQAARTRGLLVHVQELGEPGAPVPQVGHAVLAAVDAVISALPPQQVVLTVLASGDRVELYMTFGQPPRVIPDVARFGREVPAAARWRARVTAEQTGVAGCLEISWAEGRWDGAVDRRH
jgi:hypothetical protein